MPLLRRIIANELENNEIEDRNFLISPCQNDGTGDGGDKDENIDNYYDIESSRQTSPEDKENICSHSFSNNRVFKWDELSLALQCFLPDDFTYVITEFSILPTESFPGAPKYAYKATVRVDSKTEESAKSWVEKMMMHCCCTYRHTKGRKIESKKVVYKALMHCQHKRKALSLKQQQRAKPQHGRNVLTQDNRRKKTECPSRMIVTVKIPTKKDHRLSEVNPYLLTHLTEIQITFNHNHPIDSAHVLSFRPIAPETKEVFFEIFRKGHTAASAYHWHETKLYLDSSENQLLLADRAFNPTKSDISRLHSEWQKKELGSENGKPMFNQLKLEIEA
jgi:hypothetical protein